MSTPSEVYGARGEAYRLIAKLPGNHGFAVRPIRCTAEEDEPWLDLPEVVAEVFAKPPVAKFEARGAELTGEISALREQRDKVQAEVASAKRESAKLVTRLKSVSALRYIDDVLAGRITHFAIGGGWQGWRVETFDKAMASDENRHEKKLRLLSLYGSTKGNLQWEINHYSDGSGGGSGAYPFTSEGAALAFVREKIAVALFAQIPAPDSRADGLVRDANIFGVPVPVSVLSFVDNKQRASAEKAVAEAQAKLDAALFALAPLLDMTTPFLVAPEGGGE